MSRSGSAFPPVLVTPSRLFAVYRTRQWRTNHHAGLWLWSQASGEAEGCGSAMISNGGLLPLRLPAKSRQQVCLRWAVELIFALNVCNYGAIPVMTHPMGAAFSAEAVSLGQWHQCEPGLCRQLLRGFRNKPGRSCLWQWRSWNIESGMPLGSWNIGESHHCDGPAGAVLLREWLKLIYHQHGTIPTMTHSCAWLLTSFLMASKLSHLSPDVLPWHDPFCRFALQLW